jgi:hypothetical protein
MTEMLDRSFETSDITDPTTEWHIPKDLTPINNAGITSILGSSDMFITYILQSSATSLAMCFTLIKNYKFPWPTTLCNRNDEYSEINKFLNIQLSQKQQQVN